MIDTKPIPDRSYFTASEVAELLLVSTNSIRAWANKGLIRSEVTLGGHRRFPRSEIERVIQKHKRKTQHASPRLLIVCGDMDLANRLAQRLAAAIEGIAVSIATDCFTAGVMAQSTLPDFMLLDLQMPGVHGLQICSLLKSNEQTRHIRIFVLTEKAPEAAVQDLLQAGAEQCLPKPVKLATLLRAIQSQVNPGGY